VSNEWDNDDFWDFEKYRNSAPSGGAGVEVTADPTRPATTDPVEAAARAFEPKPDWNEDPARWGREKLREWYWSAQVEILLSLAQNRYTAVQSCHDSGKSFIAARAAVKWLDQYEPGEAFVVSTAPTSAQVSAILWREIGKAHKAGAFKGTITTAGYPQWKIEGELVGYGRKPADYSQSAFQGIHARFVLVIVDEACGVDANLFNAVDALVTNANARVLAIGNPDDPTSHFATICKPDSGWNVIRIDGLRTPNFTQDAVQWLDCPQCRQHGREENLLSRLYREEALPFSEEYVPEDLRDMLLSPLWVEERLHRWVGLPGDEQTLSELAVLSPLFVSKVRGLFPDSNSQGLIPLGWVESAMARWQDWHDAGSPPDETMVQRHILGCDIADQGEDSTVVAFREGNTVRELRKYRMSDTMETTGYVKASMSSRPGSLAIVDSIGVGAGVLSRLREQKVRALGFVASGSAKGLKDRTGEFTFSNLRAAAWWRLRELLDPSQPGGSDIRLPPSEILKADLTVPHWKVLSGGSIQVESKDDIRKRLGRSTDEGDAVVMCFWQGRGRVDAAQSGVVSWWDEPAEGSVVSWGVEEEVSRQYGATV
jgi:hypothetical protein